MDKAVEQVEREITKILSERFGIVSDGWTHNSVHYFGLFACFAEGEIGKTILLAVVRDFENEIIVETENSQYDD